MSPDQPAIHDEHDADAHRHGRFGLSLAVALALCAAAFSYFGTRDSWVPATGSPGATTVFSSGVEPDPAWDLDLPQGPNRDEFQTSCLICHSARLPLGQPRFKREKWAEVVHKMVAVYGASPDARRRGEGRRIPARRPAPRPVTNAPT